MITKGKWEVKYDFNVFSGRRVIASCGGYADNWKADEVHKENVNNAEFIVSACNACKAINEEHPELVAQNIKDMYEALTRIKELSSKYLYKDTNVMDFGAAKRELDNLIVAVLSKIKGGELK